jgi:DNA-binding CsgD family transcriptional regulator
VSLLRVSEAGPANIGGDTLEPGVAAEALPAVLEELDPAALLVGPDGGVILANASARAYAEESPERLRTEIAQSLRGAPCAFRARPVEAPAAATHWLVVERIVPGDAWPRARRIGAAWGLTPRQREVLAGVASGLSNRELARRLGCSQATVEAHLRSLFVHVGCHGRAALVARFWTSP